MNEESERQLAMAKRMIAALAHDEPEELPSSGPADALSKFEEERRYNPPLFTWEDETQEYLIFWSGAPYSVGLDTLGTPLALLGWVSTIGDKDWPLTTGRRLADWVDDVCVRQGWSLPQ